MLMIRRNIRLKSRLPWAIHYYIDGEKTCLRVTSSCLIGTLPASVFPHFRAEPRASRVLWAPLDGCRSRSVCWELSSSACRLEHRPRQRVAWCSLECLPQFECSEIWRIVRKHKAAGAISEYGWRRETRLDQGGTRNSHHSPDHRSRAVRNTANIVLIHPIQGFILSQRAEPRRSQASVSFRRWDCWGSEGRNPA